MRVLGIVTARGGSKGIPRKNVRLLCGRPLLAYTAQSALQSRRLSDVVLSTDDEEIAREGRRCGLEVPFMRPAELAQDNTPSLDVALHAARELESTGRRYDAICLLQPTTPLRGAAMIDGCIELLERARADSVFTVLPVPDNYNPHWVYLADDDGRLELCTGGNDPIPRRQELPTAWHREGSVYVTRWSVLTELKSLYGRHSVGYPVDPAQSVNIDRPEDWKRAEQLLTRTNVAVDFSA